MPRRVDRDSAFPASVGFVALESGETPSLFLVEPAAEEVGPALSTVPGQPSGPGIIHKGGMPTLEEVLRKHQVAVVVLEKKSRRLARVERSYLASRRPQGSQGAGAAFVRNPTKTARLERNVLTALAGAAAFFGVGYGWSVASKTFPIGPGVPLFGLMAVGVLVATVRAHARERARRS